MGHRKRRLVKLSPRARRMRLLLPLYLRSVARENEGDGDVKECVECADDVAAERSAEW